MEIDTYKNLVAESCVNLALNIYSYCVREVKGLPLRVFHTLAINGFTAIQLKKGYFAVKFYSAVSTLCIGASSIHCADKKHLFVDQRSARCVWFLG